MLCIHTGGCSSAATTSTDFRSPTLLQILEFKLGQQGTRRLVAFEVQLITG
jgi:hypothetical protein